jgi:hypothetical protein
MYRWGILRWKGSRIPAKFNFAEQYLGDVSSEVPRNQRSGFRRATQTPHKRLNLWKSPEKIPWEPRSKAAFEARPFRENLGFWAYPAPTPTPAPAPPLSIP